jgi:hypothetical protein
MHTYEWIAQCRTCREIVESVADNPARTRETAEKVDDWREAGYLVSKVTRMFVLARKTGRGCTCAKVAE